MTISAERGKSIFRKTETELLRLASDDHSEAVHGFRTTTRRLETLLGQLVRDGSRRNKKLLKMLNRIRKSAGRVRDIDVQLEVLGSLQIPQEPRRKTQLMHNLLDLRAEHEKHLRKVLKKDDIRDIRKRLRRAEAALRLDSNRDPLWVAKQMLSSVQTPHGTADEETLHRYRLAVKRARYAAEFAPKSAESTQLLAGLKRLQDALGNWHDWMTLTHTATDRLGDVSQSSLVAVLHNVTRGKYRQAVTAVSRAAIEPPRTRKRAVESKAARKADGKGTVIERHTGRAA
jgi:CHAD domain-containing protein